jgi:opacity protein-like surface antigen
MRDREGAAVEAFDDRRSAKASAELGAGAAPSSAQTTRAYVAGSGGFAVAPDGTTGDVMGEVGVQIAPNLYVFGDLGRFQNIQPSQIQPSIDVTTASLASGGLGVTGTAQVPAWYSLGGVRVTIPTRGRVWPYVFGGAGFARMTPTAQFTFASGTLSGSTPNVGDDVTSQLVALGDFTQPPATNALMVAGGGGVEVPLAPRFSVDVGYRVSRIAADTPLTTQSVTFGFGYRF